MPWLIWKGTDSREMGLVIDTPPRVLPAERVEQVTIPGRPGALLRTEGEAVYNPYVLTVHAANRRSANLQAILSWLRGSGQLVLSTEPDRVYEARILAEGQLDRVFNGVWQGDVQFLVQPLRGQYPPEPPILAVPSQSVTALDLYNPGDAPARSLYTLTGTGDVILSMDEVPAFEVVFPEEDPGTVTVDTDAGVTLLAGENYSNHVSGSYRALWIPRGAHQISWSGEGSLTALGVQPRWRWV